MKKEIDVRWTLPGEKNQEVSFKQKLFVQNDKIIPELKIQVLNGDLKDYYALAHFYMPDKTDIYTESKIIADEAYIVKIPDVALTQIGSHYVFFGLKSSLDDSTLSMPHLLEYEVLENKQLGADCTVPQTAVTLVIDLLKDLTDKINEAKGIVFSSIDLYTTDTVVNGAEVDTGVNIDNISPGKRIFVSTSMSKGIGPNMKVLAQFQGIYIKTLLDNKDDIILNSVKESTGGQDIILKFWLSSKTNTLNYSVEFGSDISMDGVDIIVI